MRRADLDGLRLIVSQRGSLMRQLVDDVLAHGARVHIAAEVAHRTSILPLVMAGLGHAVMPSSWNDIAVAVGARVRRIEPTSVLRVLAVWEPSTLTPGAAAFLRVIEGERRRAAPAHQLIGSAYEAALLTGLGRTPGAAG